MSFVLLDKTGKNWNLNASISQNLKSNQVLATLRINLVIGLKADSFPTSQLLNQFGLTQDESGVKFQLISMKALTNFLEENM